MPTIVGDVDANSILSTIQAGGATMDKPPSEITEAPIAGTGSLTFVTDDGTEIPTRRHINPDGSPGGWVALTAWVDATAIVKKYGFVWPNAEVGPGEVVHGDRFDGGVFPKLANG